MRETPEYRDFFALEFDASRYANSIIAAEAITLRLGQLAAGVATLDGALRHQVSAHHSDLVEQVGRIEALEGVLGTVTERVRGLQKQVASQAQRLRMPYERLVTRTAQLKRLQAACELLRCALRHTSLCRRLREQLRASIGAGNIGSNSNTGGGSEKGGGPQVSLLRWLTHLVSWRRFPCLVE